MLLSTALKDAFNKIGSKSISLSALDRRVPEIRFYSLTFNELRLQPHLSRRATTKALSRQSKYAWNKCLPPSQKKTLILCKVRKLHLVKGLMEKFNWLSIDQLAY